MWYASKGSLLEKIALRTVMSPEKLSSISLYTLGGALTGPELTLITLRNRFRFPRLRLALSCYTSALQQTVPLIL